MELTFVLGGAFLLFLIGAILYFVLNKKSDSPVSEHMLDRVTMHIAVPKYNEKTPLAAEQLYASLHGIIRDLKRSEDFISLELSSNTEGIKFYVSTPAHLQKFIQGQIYAQYPDAEIFIVPDYADVRKWSKENTQIFIAGTEVELAKEFIFPIKTFKDFEVDPMAAITAAMSKLELGEEVWVQVLVRPVSNYWQDICKDYVEAVREGKDPAKIGGFRSGFLSVLSVFGDILSVFVKAAAVSSKEGAKSTERKEIVRLAPGQEEEITKIIEKMTKVGLETVIRIVAKAYDQMSAENLLNDVVASFKQFTTAHLNSFTKSVLKNVNSIDILNVYSERFMPNEVLDILNIEELASVFHLPNVSVETPNIFWSGAKKAEPPLDLPVNQGTIFAETNYRGIKVPFGIKKDDRRRHMYLLGKTGTGKSTLFKNMIVSDILAGEQVVVLDPHGDLVEWLLDYIPSNRINDVVYLDPSDVEKPIAFNMLELEDISQRDLVADGIVDVFQKQFGNSWGPRLHYILYNCVSTLLEAQNQSLLGIQRLLLDKGYRKFILKQVKDPILFKFWNEEFAQMQGNSKLVSEAIAPIQNKVGRFLSSSTIRNIVGQIKSTIRMEDIINNGKIFLVNLSQGKIGEESSALFGGMIITRLLAAAMKRVNIPEEQRKDCFLYVDEFQNFATSTFAKILSEARKYRLNLVVTHQYIAQLTQDVSDAVFGNVGTIATYVISPQDASILEHEFAPVFTEQDLITLNKYEMYIKLMIDGRISAQFSANSLSVRYSSNPNRSKVLTYSKEQYGKERTIVEDKIRRWATQVYSDKGNMVKRLEPK